MGAYPGFLIRQGDRNDYVRQIQTCLNNVISAGLATDGVFSQQTLAAVRSFQQSRGLNPDGIVGPLTWGALSSACSGGTAGAGAMDAYPGFLIRQGARGDYVQQIQTCLNRVNNAGLATDGVFGPLTNAAVVNYQRINGLTPDGIVGPLTWEHLRSRCGTSPAALRAAAPVLTPLPESVAEFWELNNFPLGIDEGTVAEVEVAPGVEENAVDEVGVEVIFDVEDVPDVELPLPQEPTHCDRPDCAYTPVLPVHPEFVPPPVAQPTMPSVQPNQSQHQMDGLLACLLIYFLYKR